MRSFEWRFEEGQPEGWDRLLRALGGGFFHSPAAVETHARGGDPLYGTAVAGSEVVALALVIRERCRIALRPLHARLLTSPAVGGGHVGDPRNAGLDALDTLRASGLAEVVVESFDADVPMSDTPLPSARVGPARTEFRIPLPGSEGGQAILERMSAAHRRKVRRADSAGWTLRAFDGEEAARVLSRVQVAAVGRRLEARREGFRPMRPKSTIDGNGKTSPGWGVQVLAAMRGDEVLSAALVGWAADRAYYVSGGSTPEGYRSSSAFWMHWRIAEELCRRGLGRYNLGGVPAAATDPGHPEHGVLRFKEGFGGEEVSCRSVTMTFRPGHAALHRWVRVLRGGFARRSPD